MPEVVFETPRLLGRRLDPGDHAAMLQHVASQRVLAKAGMERGALRENDDGSKTQLFHWRA